MFYWDRYHIENYLVEPRFIRAASDALQGKDAFDRDEDALESLRDCAREVIPRLVLEELQREINGKLISTIAVRGKPDTRTPAEELKASIIGSRQRFHQATETLLEGSAMEDRAKELKGELEASLETGEWIRLVLGRLILGRFVSRNIPGVMYEAFRNLILDQMVDDAFEPSGMRVVLDKIEGAVTEEDESLGITGPQSS